MAEIRRLGPGDEHLVRVLGEERELEGGDAAALLADPAVRFLVAFEEGVPAGFVFAYVLPRRRLPRRSLLLYEIDVAEPYRRRGIGRALMDAVEAEARAAGCDEGWVLTDADNGAALALYAAAGGIRSEGEVVMLDFDYTRQEP